MCVTGMIFRKPLNRRTSMTLPIACITLPAGEEQQRLEERVREQVEHRRAHSERRATSHPPYQAARNMNPSWLTVEYASTRLRSVCSAAR